MKSHAASLSCVVDGLTEQIRSHWDSRGLRALQGICASGEATATHAGYRDKLCRMYRMGWGLTIVQTCEARGQPSAVAEALLHAPWHRVNLPVRWTQTTGESGQDGIQELNDGLQTRPAAALQATAQDRQRRDAGIGLTTATAALQSLAFAEPLPFGGPLAAQIRRQERRSKPAASKLQAHLPLPA